MTRRLGDAITIRLARAADLPALADLAFRSKATWGYDAAFMEACRAELTLQMADLETNVVAVIDGPAGRPVAMAEVSPAGAVAELHKLFVDPACQGDGLGRRLVNWATQVADVPSGSIPGRVIPLFRISL